MSNVQIAALVVIIAGFLAAPIALLWRKFNDHCRVQKAVEGYESRLALAKEWEEVCDKRSEIETLRTEELYMVRPYTRMYTTYYTPEELRAEINRLKAVKYEEQKRELAVYRQRVEDLEKLNRSLVNYVGPVISFGHNGDLNRTPPADNKKKKRSR